MATAPVRGQAKGGTSVAAGPAATTPIATAVPPKRITGLDMTRGLAVLGMMAVHVYPDFNRNGTPSAAFAIAAGRSMATFVLMAGVSLALMTGGRHPVEGRARTAARAALTVRALMIGLIGFGLGYLPLPVSDILPYYAVMFVLALPLIGLPPRALAALAIVIALAVPVVNLVLGNHVSLQQDPTFASLRHPYYLAGGLLFNGEYPALPLLAFICAGMALGRLRLSSARVGARLLGGGVALALAAWFTSDVLLLHMGGLQGLQAAGAVADGLPPGQVHDYLLWQPDNVPSWWWLAVRAPYTSTPIDLLHAMGVAVAVLGGMLLLSRVSGPVLKPLAALGSMTLTIYCAHLVYISFDPLANDPLLSYAVQVSVALTFAVIWRRFRGQGPLEKLIAVVAGRARRAVATAPGRPSPARPIPSGLG
ncbi:MAG TPA: heparan-alpha-glucosaminide N-acetyltransferase domain-containing protein [Streptosporangiaceae bacterium]